MQNVSDYLSIGYLYLLVLGVVSDSIFYSMLGINIMSYSSILDVLLSPVVHLTSSMVFPILIIIIPALSYFVLKSAKRASAKKVAAGQKPDYLTTLPLMTGWLIFTAWIIFSAYIGLGFGGGSTVSEKLETGDFKLNHRLVFLDKSETSINLVGNNSGYVFYIEEGTNSVSVTPVSSLLKIEKIKQPD